MNTIKLDNQYRFLFENEVIKNFIPIKINSDLFGITFHHKDDDAFVLVGPKSGCTSINKNITSEKLKEKHNGFIVRATISYSQAEKIDKDFATGCIYLGNLINTILFKIQDYRQDIDQKYKHISFLRPDGHKTIFRELENSAGLELRLYVEF